MPKVSWIGEQRRQVDVFRVDLVDHDHAAQPARLRPLHHAPRGEFDAGLRVDHDGRGVHRGERADRLAGEIRDAGRVDQVNARVARRRS